LPVTDNVASIEKGPVGSHDTVDDDSDIVLVEYDSDTGTSCDAEERCVYTYGGVYIDDSYNHIVLMRKLRIM